MTPPPPQSSSQTGASQTAASAAGTVTLGDVTINRMAFGTMRLTGPGIWGDPADPAEARRVLRRAVERGVNYVDTAAYYGPLVSDRLIVEALYPYPTGLVIGTKVGAWRGSDKSWPPAARPEQLRATIDDNLNRLRLEQLHLVHFRFTEQAGVPLADSLDVMAELQRAGKIRHIGISNVSLAQAQEARSIVRVASVQNLYNLTDRHDEEVVEYCAREGIPYMPFFPLAVGTLGRGTAPLVAIARRHAATPAQVALAWLLARSPQMTLIPGTSSLTHLEENIAAASLRLSDEERRELAENAV